MSAAKAFGVAMLALLIIACTACGGSDEPIKDALITTPCQQQDRSTCQ